MAQINWWYVRLKNERGDQLQEFKGTPEGILEEVQKSLPYPQNEMWVEALKVEFKNRGAMK